MSAEMPSVFPVPRPLSDLPNGLFTPSAEVGEVAVLLADSDARASGWGGEVTLDLARLWSKRGLKVFLADGVLHEPELHDRLGLANGEGISDAVVYGVSPTRMAQYQEEAGFLFAPAGTVVADAEAVYRSSRWPALLRAFRESGAVLLLYLPEEAPGVEDLIREGDRVLHLASTPPDGIPDPGTVVLHPEGASRAEAEAPPSSDFSLEAMPETGPTGDPESEFALEAEPVEPAQEAEAVQVLEPAEAVHGEEEVEMAEAEPTAAPPQPRSVKRRVSPVLLLILLVVLAMLGVLGAAFLGYLEIPGLPLPLGFIEAGHFHSTVSR